MFEIGRDAESSKRKPVIGNYIQNAVPAALALLCYVNGLSGAFVHDDVMAIQHNPDVTGQSDLSSVFHHDFWGTSMRDAASHKSYRPISVLTFRLDYYFSGGDPRWFHAVNIGLHALVVVLLANICLSALNMSRLSTFVTTCLFAVHPIHTEAVTGIVGRADVMAAVFFLLSFYFYTRHGPKRDVNDNMPTEGLTGLSTEQMLMMAASMVLALVAMLTKETGLTVLGVSLSYDALVNWKKISKISGKAVSIERKRLVYRCLITLITLLLLLILRMTIMNFEQPNFKPEDNPASFSSSFITRVLSFNYIVCYNFWLLLCPSMLCYDWTGNSIPLVESVLDSRNIYTVLVYTLTLISCWKPLRKMLGNPDTSDRHHFVFLISMALMVIPFVPASNLFFRVGFVIAERVLYIPSIGFCIMVGQGCQMIYSAVPKLRAILSVTILTLLLVMAAKTCLRNTVWETRESLFMSGVKDMPQNAKVHYNMGNFLKDKGDKIGAEHHYRIAIKLNPHHPSYHSNLGTVLSNATESKECYLTALRLLPNHKNSLLNLGNLLIENEDQSGVSLIQDALKIDPNFIEALLIMGKVFLKDKNVLEAEKYFSRALRLAPLRSDVRFSYGYYLHMTNQSEAALQEYQQALALDPNEITTIQFTAAIYSDRGDYHEAEHLLRRALFVKDDCSDCLSALGSVYAKTGHSNKAVITLAKAAELAPNNTKINLKYITALKENKQREEAKKHLQHLISKLPRDFMVIQFAYNLSMEENRLTDASQLIAEVIAFAEQRNDSQLSYFYKEQADIYRLQQDLNNALKFYEKSIAVSPEYEESIVNVGSVHYLKKNYEQAEVYYLKALAINPRNQLAKLNLKKLRTHMRQAQQRT